MKTIKRWTTGIFSRIDWAISQIENQEALINSSLKESRESVAKAKIQLKRVRQDGEKLRQKLQAEEESIVRWRDRATQIAKTDEDRALECLMRAKKSEQQRDQLVLRAKEHALVEQELAKDVESVQERLAELMEKRNLMRTRQSRAEALTSIQACSSETSTEVDDIFDRWEMRVTEKELATECGISADPLEESFDKIESEAELREELRQLLDQQK